ncbi:MAG: T9SS type A sorting domain-containing protein [Crocinitomicaceae bacterium]
MKNLLICILAITSYFSFGQEQVKYSAAENSPEWVKYMYTDNPSLFILREKFETYYASNDFKKDQHTQYFKRLLKNNWLNTDEAGYIIPAPAKRDKIIRNQVKSPTSNWEEAGPWDYDHEQAMDFQVQSPGSSHIYTVEQSPVNPDLIYAGTATAGTWMSTDKGLNWTSSTRFLDINGVYAIALHPTDANTAFFGERDGQLWKTTNNGSSWSIIGGPTLENTDKWYRDLKFIGNNTMLAATDAGLFRSSDNGVSWTNVHAGEHMEIEINPSNSNIIYAVKLNGDKTEFYKSLDNGLTWTIKTNGWPNPAAGDEQKRVEIGVSADDANIVYVWGGGEVNGLGGFYGFYKSTDAGESFSFECCGGSAGGTPTVSNPNMLGWAELGDDDGGQYYYDLAFAASPTDADRVFGAGINVWRSLDAGIAWELNAHWVTWVGANTADRYSHADVHDIKFFQNGPNVDMWVASDGGLYYSADEGDHLEPRMHGIHGTDFWGYQSGFKNGDVMLGGTYHNGTLIKYNDIYKGGLANPDEGGWLAELGGDNYRGFVNYGNPRIAYADNGAFEFSEVRTIRRNNVSFDGNNKCNTSYVTGEYGNYEFDPNNFNVFYSPVGTELMKTENGGISFTPVFDFGGNKIVQVKVSWSNPDVIYVTHKLNGSVFKIMKTIDAGITWNDVTPTTLEANGNHNRTKYIEVDEKDENKLWCILMGWQTGNKVFQSTDGGDTWTNITSPSIENENVISIAHHYGSDDGLYIGTRKTIYYRNNTLGEWVEFNNNLPTSTMCSFIQPFYGNGKIRTASQRGVYECDFYEDVPPIAMAAANKTAINLASNCLADTIQFVDHSTVRSSSATWSWTFQGGSPATSSLENPKIVYSSPGTYNVKLVVTDAFGTDSVELIGFIEVTNSYSSPQIVEDFNGAIFPPTGWKMEDSEGSGWEQDGPQDDPSNLVAGFPNYWVDATGQSHHLIMPAIEMTDATSASIAWDYTYNDNNGYTDSLALVYRTGNNPNWQTLWQKGGADLEVAGTQTWYWDAADPTIVWQNEVVDLTSLLGESCVELAFSNIGYYGNHLWIDNVNLSGTYVTGLDELSDVIININPNPSKGMFLINASALIETYTITDISGKVILTNNDVSKMNINLDISNQPNGVYFITTEVEGQLQTHKLIKQ